MINESILKENLNNTLKETNFKGLGRLYRGKVRDNYIDDDKKIRTIIATDRLSAFDRVITTIPFKGQLLSQMSNFWFSATKDIVPNHVISVPDPNVTIVKECKPFPVEMIVRAYITGSAWRDYVKGNTVSGIRLPEGLKKNQKLEHPIITPSTKELEGKHDRPISKEEIISSGLVDKDTYAILEEYAMKLFEFGQKHCAKHNLILVDTKYEFGLTDEGKVVVIDEIHTPDSSRFWIKDTYEKRFAAGEEPEILDKEFFRGWLMNEKNFMGDGEIPEVPDEIRIEIAKRYIRSYEHITGLEFKPEPGPILERIKKNLGIE